jgi:hypothetical protein
MVVLSERVESLSAVASTAQYLRGERIALCRGPIRLAVVAPDVKILPRRPKDLAAADRGLGHFVFYLMYHLPV